MRAVRSSYKVIKSNRSVLASSALTRKPNTTLRICASTATTDVAAQRRPGLVLTTIAFTTPKGSARTVT